MRDKLLRRHVIWLLGALAVSGCETTTISNPASWSPAALAISSMLPPNIAPDRRTRVVVLAPYSGAERPAAELASSASSVVEKVLGQVGVEVVSPELAVEQAQELKLAELRVDHVPAGLDIADYAITIEVGRSSWGSTYVSAFEIKHPSTDQVIKFPGGYRHSASSAMTLRVIELPSAKLIHSFPVEGMATMAGQPNPASQLEGSRLLLEATEAGIMQLRERLLEEFAPKGYVTEKRVRGNKTLFRVALGKNTGAKAGDTVNIFTRTQLGTELEVLLLGKGVLPDIVGVEGSWVLVDDEQVAARVRKYDYVKVANAGSMDGLNPGFLGRLFESATDRRTRLTLPSAPNSPPPFPWPPPAASAQTVLPIGLFVSAGASATMGEMDQKLSTALSQQGYGARGYYRVPGGFAIATRLERFGPGGEAISGAERWPGAKSGPEPFTLEGFIASLFASEPGRFRVLVFIVTDQPFAATGSPPSKSAAGDWPANGFNMLPDEVSAIAVSSRVRCTALVYEFHKPPGGKALFAAPGQLDGDSHMKGAGVLKALELP